MDEAMNQKNFKSKIKDFFDKFWNTRWCPFLFMLTIFLILFVIIVSYPALKGGFLHLNSDDLIQYYPYVAGFFDKIKKGSLSLYDPNLFGGVSIFSCAYYVPLDIFTFFAFLLSYFIPSESAYAIFNFLRIVAGGFLIYYTFSRKFSYKTAFFAGLILFIGGLSEAYYIFPVYLGICFYAPLGMLLVDLCIEKKGTYYLLLPIYSFICVLYDFYIAYMLMAFISIYFVASLHIHNVYSFFRKENCFLWNKESWKRFLEFLFFILFGVAMAAFIMMPSALYILNQTARNSEMTVRDVIYQFLENDSTIESYRYFSTAKNGAYSFSYRHYFTQFVNLFIPNEPHSFCLNDAGDYVREHCSLYLTCGGLIYLVHFFFLRGKLENRLKGWVIFVNVLLLIPIFSVLFGLNVHPYVRWFFIPYLFNLYAMAIGMDKDNFQIGEGRLSKWACFIFLYVGFFTVLYILFFDPDIFIHYDKDNPNFNIIILPSLCFIGAYALLLIIVIGLKILKLRPTFHAKIIPFLILGEFVFASCLLFGNVENTTEKYYTAKRVNSERLATMKEIYPYSDKNGYRINLYTIYGRECTNINVQLGNVNFGRFFQSFYNPELRCVLGDIYNDTYTNSNWSFYFKNGYSLISGPMFNMKYIISNENISLPTEYYNVNVKGNTSYYELKEDIPFILYEEGFKDASDLNGIEKQIAALNYIYLPKDIDSLNTFPIVDKNQIEDECESLTSVKDLTYETTVNNYFVYRLNTISDSFYKDAIHIQMTSSKIKRLTHGFMYLTNEIPEESNHNYTNYTQMHYNSFYGDASSYDYLLVENKEDNTVSSGKIYTYSYACYDSFIENQRKYTNKSFSLDGNQMRIQCVMPEENKMRILKTGYSYSKEWVANDPSYEVVNVGGGFLGILIPEDAKNIDITLTFTPEGYKTGSLISIISGILYISILGSLGIVILVKRKKRVVEE